MVFVIPCFALISGDARKLTTLSAVMSFPNSWRWRLMSCMRSSLTRRLSFQSPYGFATRTIWSMIYWQTRTQSMEAQYTPWSIEMAACRDDAAPFTICQGSGIQHSKHVAMCEGINMDCFMPLAIVPWRIESIPEIPKGFSCMNDWGSFIKLPSEVCYIPECSLKHVWLLNWHAWWCMHARSKFSWIKIWIGISLLFIIRIGFIWSIYQGLWGCLRVESKDWDSVTFLSLGNGKSYIWGGSMNLCRAAAEAEVGISGHEE